MAGPKNNAPPFSLRLPVDLLQAIDAHAEKKGITRSYVIRLACQAFIKGGDVDPVEDRFAALETRVKALESKQ